MGTFQLNAKPEMDSTWLLTSDPLVQLSSADGENLLERVLVLEDDPVQQDLLSQHLNALGFDVYRASTIEEAQRAIAENKFQLAILDVQLPDGSGFDFCEQLDSQAITAGLPVIVLSSRNGPDVIRRTRGAGGCFFLGKPYDPNVLLMLIEKALGT